ncbi:MAG: MarR family transcriptional regulator [Roseivirga sp.]|nr:MarR family transcriptional regulator [Roseivirga sp.]
MSESSDPKKFGFLLERTFRITKLSFIKVFNKLQIDVTPDQWVLLDTLNSKGELTQKEISALSFKDAATISRIIDKLEKKELVTRRSEQKDKRKTTIKLTGKGSKTVDTCQGEIDKLRKHSWQNLTEDDYENFQRIMNQVFDNFDSYQ